MATEKKAFKSTANKRGVNRKNILTQQSNSIRYVKYMSTQMYNDKLENSDQKWYLHSYSNQYIKEWGDDSVFRLLCMPSHAYSFCCDSLRPTGIKQLPSFAEERRLVRGKGTSPVTTPPPLAVAIPGGVNPHQRENSRRFPESINLLSTGGARMIYSAKESAFQIQLPESLNSCNFSLQELQEPIGSRNICCLFVGSLNNSHKWHH